jgi:hypothetical protein
MAKLPAKKAFPSNKAERDAVIAAAPERAPYDPATDAYDPNDPKTVEAFWKNGVVVRGGGVGAVRAALAAKRRRA